MAENWFTKAGVLGAFCCFSLGKITLPQKESGKRSPAKGVYETSDKSVRESDQKSPEKEKEVVELLLPTSFFGNLKMF